MKTYILRDPNSVEPQKAQFVEPQNPVPPKHAPLVNGPALLQGPDMHSYFSPSTFRHQHLFQSGGEVGT